ncbi:MAG TPA: PHP domain-containing protein [Nitrososphaerales archaeon]|nr:PHP domain-containing protein [Nitrososphaerales archaeon]
MDSAIAHSDNHNHIILASLDSMVEAAGTRNISNFSITEHISQFEFMRKLVNFTSVHEKGRIFASFEEYNAEFSRISNTSKIKLRRGLEVDYLEDYEQVIGKEVSKEDWDILLCSVHELPHGVDVEDNRLPADEESSLRRWNDYFQTQEKSLRSNFLNFNVLTHPTRLGVSTPFVPGDIDEKMRHLAQLAKERGKALEINGADLGRMSHLVEKVAKACLFTGCKVSFGSDAHFPEEVSRNFEKAYTLCKELGDL